jgi:glucosamine kinase
LGNTYKIGVDGGGSKTECILVNDAGEIVARHIAPGCNPSVVGALQAQLIVTDALNALISTSISDAAKPVSRTLLCMAGSRSFWSEFAGALADFGAVTAVDDSLPVLELATQGKPGLVLHSGTGSFVAARAPDGTVHYAGGLGWRFGDGGSGYDIGRRAIARGLLELQGWTVGSRIGPTVRDHTKLGATADAGAVSRFFYHHPDANRVVAALAPAILRLASEGDHKASEIVIESGSELLALAVRVATQLFPGIALDTLPAGLSGPILTHPAVMLALAGRSPLALTAVAGAPIDGVARLLSRS